MRDWIEITGWTLLHFVWQGAILGLLIAGVLWIYRRRSASTRYAVASGGLLALLAAPVVTGAVLWQAARTVEPSGSADRVAARALGTGATSGHALVSRNSMDAVHARLAAALPGVVAIWLAGVSLLLVRMGGGLWWVRRLHEAGFAAPASRWQEVAARLASRLGLQNAVRVVESRLVGTPTVVGWMRPIILLPVAALANLTPAQVEADPGARAGPHPPPRLPREPAAVVGGDRPVLSPGRLVGLGANPGRARALLRRRSAGDERRPPRLRRGPRRPRGVARARDGAGARRGRRPARRAGAADPGSTVRQPAAFPAPGHGLGPGARADRRGRRGAVAARRRGEPSRAGG